MPSGPRATPLHREKNRLAMCEGEFLNKDWPPGEQAGRRRRGGNWASFSGMSYVMVVTTWVDGEAESDVYVGLTARATPCKERKTGLGCANVSFRQD